MSGQQMGQKRSVGVRSLFWARACEKKYNRFTMGKRRELQCKALRRREKSRRRKNNGEQWKYNEKNNAKNNGNSRKFGRVRRPVVSD
jgi:hypothetical protein